MAAFFSLELDTTPPEVTFGEPFYSGGVLTVPYTVSEPSVLEAEATPFVGSPVTGTVTPTDLEFSFGSWNGGTIEVIAADLVGNADIFTLEIEPTSGSPDLDLPTSAEIVQRQYFVEITSIRATVAVVETTSSVDVVPKLVVMSVAPKESTVVVVPRQGAVDLG
jgi:hypothetical protein